MKRIILLFFGFFVCTLNAMEFEEFQPKTERIIEIKEEQGAPQSPKFEDPAAFLNRQNERSQIRKAKRNIFTGGVVVGGILVTAVWWAVIVATKATKC